MKNVATPQQQNNITQRNQMGGFHRLGQWINSFLSDITGNKGVVRNSDQKVKQYVTKFYLGGYVALGLIGGSISVNFMLSFSIFLTYCSWRYIFRRTVLKSPKIYSIKIATSVVADWIPISVPVGVQLRRDQLLTSISEVSAIRGSYLYVSMRVMIAISSALAMVSVHLDLRHRGRKMYHMWNRFDFVPICIMMFIFGSFFMNHFDPNKQDRYQSKMHLYGVYILSLSSLMIGFVTEWSTFSRLLIFSYFGVCAYKKYWIGLAKENVSTNLNTITMLSKKCLVLDLIMFDIFATILILTVNGSGGNEGNIWVVF